jgi:hypothetical protein
VSATYLGKIALSVSAGSMTVLATWLSQFITQEKEVDGDVVGLLVLVWTWYLMILI